MRRYDKAAWVTGVAAVIVTVAWGWFVYDTVAGWLR